MCGRYTLTAEATQLARHFTLVDTPREFVPRCNIVPTQQVPIVRDIKGLGRHLDFVRWGLLPRWAKDQSLGKRLYNARVETVAEKPAFRAAFQRRRCLLPADGFYEWKATGKNKQPYWIGLQDRQLFAFAGLWEHWEAPDGSGIVESCTLITTEANGGIQALHERMPVILEPSLYTPWLSAEQNPKELLNLLHTSRGETLIYYPVSRAVNNPRNDSAELLLPIQTNH